MRSLLKGALNQTSAIDYTSKIYEFPIYELQISEAFNLFKAFDPTCIQALYYRFVHFKNEQSTCFWTPKVELVVALRLNG